MKLNRGFVAFIIAVLVLIILSQYLQPKTFVWHATFLPNDRQPLGCYVFDSIMRQSLPNGYEVTDETFYQLNHDGVKEPRNILVITRDFDYRKVDIQQMDELLRKGNKIFISTCDELCIDKNPKVTMQKYGVTWDCFYEIPTDVKININRNHQNKDYLDTLNWIGIPDVYKPCSYVYEEALSSSELDLTDTLNIKWNTIAYQTFEADTLIMTAACRVGKGELIVSGIPLLMTNYGILNRSTGPYVMRLMSMLDDRPVVRTTGYMKTEESYDTEHSPMKVLLNYPSLRHALWLALIGVLLFFIFTAKRRQRVIPVITKPHNSNLEFIKMIGSLFFQRHQNHDIVARRWKCFTDDVNRLAGVDLNDARNIKGQTELLARKTGLAKDETEQNIDEIIRIVDGDKELTDKLMRHLIDVMNTITEKLK